MEEHRLWVLENRVLRRIFGSKREEVAKGFRQLYKCTWPCGLNNIYS
jgi:hypothetical protein